MGLYRRGNAWWGRYKGERKSLGISADSADKMPRKELAQDTYRKWTLEVDEDKKFPGRREERTRTLKDLLDRYMTDHGAKLKSAPNLRIYVKTLLSHLDGGMTLDRLTSNDVENYKTARAVSVGPAAINRELQTLGAAFNLAIKKWEWYFQLNPVWKAGLLDEGEGRIRWLSNKHDEDEYSRLQKAAPAWFWDICLFTIATGLRREELTRMTWDDVDVKQRALAIPESKSGKAAAIPLLDPAWTVLQRQVRSTATKAVFYDPRHRPYKPDYLTRQMAAWTMKAGIDDFRFHDLRHTAATYLIRQGVDIYTVQRLMRHESVEMTKRYAHHDVESVRVGIEASTKQGTAAS